jgi:hypothetical protein
MSLVRHKNVGEIIMKVYKPYSYSFFLKNYSGCCDSMWRNYLEHQKNKYDWFIKLTSETYYANGTFEKIIEWLKNKEDKYVTIENLNWTPELQYQAPHFYYWYNTEKYKAIIAEYNNQRGTSIKRKNMNTNEVTWEAWEEDLLRYIRNNMVISFFYSNQNGLYRIEYNYKDDKWETIKMVSPYNKREINADDVKYIQKILTKTNKCGDFYKEGIETVSNLLGLCT